MKIMNEQQNMEWSSQELSNLKTRLMRRVYFSWFLKKALGPALIALPLAGLVLWSGRRAPRALAAGALAFWGVAGLAGLTLAFLWLGTAHVAAHGNENLLLLSPLAWLLLPGGWRIARGRAAGPLFAPVLLAVAGLAALAVFVYGLQLLPQRNAHWIALLLPIHAALAWTLARPAIRRRHPLTGPAA